MNFKSRIILSSAAAVLVMAHPSQALVLFSQDFEAATVGQFASAGNGFITATGNIGGPAITWEITANGGVASSKGMNVLFDGTGRPGYIIGFGATQPAASDANPLGNGSISDPSQIRFSVDLKTTGNLNSTPVRLRIYQQDDSYEADRGIDANMDGDMTDGATVFQSDYWPTLVAGDYNHASYTLDLGQISARILGPGQSIPITPQLDPTLSLLSSVYFDYVGFGLDAGNVVSVDNFLIEAVPEPSTFFLLTIGAVSLLGRRRAS